MLAPTIRRSPWVWISQSRAQVTSWADADRAASMVADGLSQLADAEFWKFPADDLLDTAHGIELPG